MDTWRRLAAGLVIVVSASSLTSAAVADQHTRRDVRGDVAGPDGTEATRRAGDLVGFRTAYPGNTVVLTARFRDLPEPYYLLFVPVKTPGRERGIIFQDNGTGSGVVIRRGIGQEVPCPGATGEVRPVRSRVVITIPSRCLGSPRWVRTGLQVSQDGPSGDWTDTAGVDGESAAAPLGPRVRRR